MALLCLHYERALNTHQQSIFSEFWQQPFDLGTIIVPIFIDENTEA